MQNFKLKHYLILFFVKDIKRDIINKNRIYYRFILLINIPIKDKIQIKYIY